MTALSSLAQRVASELTLRGETLAVVEASSGGRVSAALTAIPGSSRWFLGGAVAYSAAAKQRLLGLSDDDVRASGAVDATTAAVLAQAVRVRLSATWGVAETGIAGPQTGRRSTKPVGLAYIGVASASGTQARELRTGMDGRDANQTTFAEAALEALVDALTG